MRGKWNHTPLNTGKRHQMIFNLKSEAEICQEQVQAVTQQQLGGHERGSTLVLQIPALGQRAQT